MSSFFKAFDSRRVAIMIPLGFASGMPNPLVGTTLTAWMATEGVSLATIGVFAFVSLPYNLKFLWAPLLDRYRLPWLGRRRDWMLLTQVLLLGAVAAMGFTSPAASPSTLAALALVVAFLGATQDIASDAYRTDTLATHERASGTAVFVAGYRLALIAAGAGALILSDLVPWRAVYWILSALMLVGVLGTLLAPRPEARDLPPRTLGEAVVAPLVEVFRRHGTKSAVATLAIVMLYKVGDAFAGHLLIPFLMEMGFPRSEIGAVAKGLGLAATILGALLGGGLVAKLGLRRSLLAFGLLQAVANLLYALLAVTGRSHGLLVVSIGVDNLCGGLGTAAFVAYLMSLCNRRFTAFQYALLSGLSTVPGRVLGISSGVVAEAMGWPAFFLLTIAAAAPALALLWLREVPEEVREEA
jgi:PAT family beta-lactamase induction signal transducer AmpG